MPFSRRVLFALAFSLSAAAAFADDLTTGAGKKMSGKLVAIDAQGVTFSTGDARVTIPGKEIVLLDLGNKVAPMPKAEGGKSLVHEVELTDGSTFRVAKYSLKGKKFETELATVPAGVPVPSYEVPLNTVFSVMRGAEEPKNRDAWYKILANRGKRDMYVERTLNGLNFIQGTVLSGSDDGRTFEFELEGKAGDPPKKADPPLIQSRATGGLIFSQPAPAQIPATLCKVLDVFGNSLVAQAVQLTPEGVTVTTVSGVVVKYQSTAAIARFDYAQGNVAYLSDLDPQVQAPELPPEERRLNTTPPFFRDHGPSGEAIRFGSELPYQKGLVIAPDTILTYTVPGDYRDFKAVLGIPDSSPDANLEAKVTIEADDKVVFSETIKRKDKPKPIAIDIKGVKKLRVIVEADLPVNGNRVVLADARIQK
jgi:hypothetical protein